MGSLSCLVTVSLFLCFLRSCSKFYLDLHDVQSVKSVFIIQFAVLIEVCLQINLKAIALKLQAFLSTKLVHLWCTNHCNLWLIKHKPYKIVNNLGYLFSISLAISPSICFLDREKAKTNN